MSKIDSGKFSIEHNPFSLETILKDVASHIGKQSADKGLELTLDVANDIPVELVGDELRVGQLLLNYASNALKFTEHGEVNIIVRLREQTDDDVLLYFAVRDTGIGLSQQQVERLFTSFNQADTSTTRKYGGTGLGLAINKQLAELMGGEVGVESCEGQGSTFWFTVRLRTGQASEHHLALSPDLQGRRVLVVDDNDNARQIMNEMLSGMQFDVDVAASAKVAVAAVKQAEHEHRPYELVFMDWQMPFMNGIEGCCEIQALKLTEPPNMVLVTAYGHEDILREAYEAAGVHDVLIKPVTASTLFDATIRVLNTNRVEIPESDTQTFLLCDGLNAIAGAHVLLVEDNEINQQVALELLHHMQLTADVAENGREALLLLEEREYNLVLMDMQMPVMDGITATQNLRHIPHLEKLPVIAMTANAQDADRKCCMEAGMNDFLSKPVEPELLWEMLLKWIPERHAPEHKTASTEVSVSDLEIDGIDSVPALRRMLNNSALYEAVLRKFCIQQEHAVPSARAALDAGDRGTARRHIHTLKGVSASIGAHLLEKQAAALELALAETGHEDDINVQLEVLEVALRELIGRIHTRLQLSSAQLTAAKPADMTLLTEMERLLNDSNPEVMTWLDNNLQALKVMLPMNSLSKISAAVHACDFDEALSLLRLTTTNFKQESNR